VRMVDAKLAAARAGGADVFFTPERPSAAPAAAIASHAGRPAPERTIGDWLATAAYEAAGRAARGTPPGTAAVVVVDDVRQAIAWLCGRTQLDATCAVAHAAAGAALGAARPLSSTVPSPTAATVHRRMEER